MPSSILIFSLTIVANNAHHLRKIRRNWLQRNRHSHGAPRGSHPFCSLDRLFAHGTPTVKSGEFAEAVPMNRVSTRHFMTGTSAGEQILLTDRTIAHVFANLARMFPEQRGIDAHATIVTMTKVVTATDATESTVVAVVGFFHILHPQVAYIAVVISELNVAVNTLVGLARLTRVAFSTDGFRNGKAIDTVVLVVIIHRLVHGHG